MLGDDELLHVILAHGWTRNMSHNILYWQVFGSLPSFCSSSVIEHPWGVSVEVCKSRLSVGHILSRVQGEAFRLDTGSPNMCSGTVHRLILPPTAWTVFILKTRLSL